MEPQHLQSETLIVSVKSKKWIN